MNTMAYNLFFTVSNYETCEGKFSHDTVNQTTIENLSDDEIIVISTPSKNDQLFSSTSKFINLVPYMYICMATITQ